MKTAFVGLRYLLIVIATLILYAPDMKAQGKLFTLEDLNYGGRNYRNLQPTKAYYAWWGDELIQTEVEHCYLIDKKTGKRTLLFSIDDVNSTPEQFKMYHFLYATFPYPDKTIVVLENGKQRVLYDWVKKEAASITDCSEEDDGEWCPASRASAYVQDGQLCVRTADGTKHTLTQDGSREIVYGQSVHRDEFGIYKGTFWSPDGQRLAFYRMDQSMVTDYPQVNIGTRIATEEPDKYPMAGETSHKVTVGVYDLQTQHMVYLDAGDPTDRYFTNVQWSPDSKKIYIFELNRDQTDYALVRYDAETGAKEATLFSEHNDKYAEPLNPITFLPWDETKFIVQSQRDGYNHLYLYDTDGKMLKQLTQGPWVVLDLIGFDCRGKNVVILSTEANPIQNNLYTVNVKSGRRTAIDNGEGVHGSIWSASGHRNAMLSASGRYVYDVYSAPDVPRKIDVTDVSTGKRVNLLTADDPWKEFQVPEYSCGTLKAADGKTDLYYRMVKPADFDPSKKYPTVVYVYGGPHSRNVEASWHYASRSWETYMAQNGYILFILDNRGSCDRGLAFEQATFRQLGQIEMQDQMKGVEYLKSLPYVDADRLGVHGWSFGGFMTISLMTNYPDVFKVGVAGGPVIDWKWYEVMYGERYMDTPQTNPEGYEKTSLLKQAPKLKGKLQIIQGLNDKTVVPQHCLSFIEACIENGTQPDFFVYPGEPHNMRGHKSVHLHERITQYFEDYLK